jgi:hypothetical protein
VVNISFRYFLAASTIIEPAASMNQGFGLEAILTGVAGRKNAMFTALVTG